MCVCVCVQKIGVPLDGLDLGVRAELHVRRAEESRARLAPGHREHNGVHQMFNERARHDDANVLVEVGVVLVEVTDSSCGLAHRQANISSCFCALGSRRRIRIPVDVVRDHIGRDHGFASEACGDDCTCQLRVRDFGVVERVLFQFVAIEHGPFASLQHPLCE